MNLGSSTFETTVQEAGDGKALVRVLGDLDLAGAEQLREALTAAIVSHETTVLDLGSCAFMDSTGLRVLLAGVRRATEAGHALRLSAVRPEVWRVIELTGTDTLLPAYADVNAAFEATFKAQ